MRFFFELKKISSKNKSDKLLNDIYSRLSKARGFDNGNEYRKVIIDVVKLIKKNKVKSSNLSYKKEVSFIKNKHPLSESTNWGGVNLKMVDVDKNYIKKLLVISRAGVLGFEIHKLKHEKLKILEGICLVLYSNHNAPGWKKGNILTRFAAPGDKFEFFPRDEHGIIAITPTVIQEESTNHLDDLIYIFSL